MKPIKMHTEGGKWYIENGSRTVTFDDSKDAWLYIEYQLIIRAAIKMHSARGASEPYPVRSLIPTIGRSQKNELVRRSTC